MRPPYVIILYFFCVQYTSFAQIPVDTLAPNDSPAAAALRTTNTTTPTPPQSPALTSALSDSNALQPSKGRLLKRFFVEKYPNPRAAALLSFVLPGAGQAYNKKWWKIPLVYGALGGMTWLAVDNGQQYQALKKNYQWVVDGDPNTNPTEQPYVYMNAAQMKGYRDQYRGFSEKSYLFLGITYLLAVTDAFVDAHLSRFDVSDDLSLRVEPDIQSVPNGFGACFGVGVQLDFGNAKTTLR
jgi:hypothetical protein